ncbi:tubulin binding cofactor A-domain-containing protein [Pyronema domesticum]|uniref:Tubulin-specific chaperone A n=1 Tax=Pyronema omphalodes (strain CBS 100304) TaxID=1076935 RepID=U4LUI3_PYROM|nr:tubulin binding cofactor A-domain-containing protein [Pyronema domesticum]CCX31681.1 Similar to Tubulin-specific chaperone A; acc. no. P48606 [Pyronema omphalodes CBS 100304]
MPPPTILAIKTSAVKRFINDEAGYHQELAVEQARLEKMEKDGESDEYAIAQQKKVVEETKAAIPVVRGKLELAVKELESQLQAATNETDLVKENARNAISNGEKVLATVV